MEYRYNILNLLGSDSKKYQSCILTSYTFDFLYFEQRILPVLHGAGIVNINLFVDANMFNKELELTENKQLHGKKSYSITPVYMDGAFHPKILLAVGKKKGMLAIGSGNLTSSGMSSNDEIWSAFHIADISDPTYPFFAEMISYFKHLQGNAYSCNLEKLNWIPANSIWYDGLSKTEPSLAQMEYDGQIIRILKTHGDHSIYRQMISMLPQNPACIKILSPYYNKNGGLINHLYHDLQPATIHCVVDPRFGSVPGQFESHVSVEFSDWNNLKKEDRYKNARLHAKAIQFGYEKETWFLLGSANATIEAFGTTDRNSVNSEACILISNPQKIDFFQELNILFPEKGGPLTQINFPEKQNDQGSDQRSNQTIRILHAEWEANELLLFLDDCKEIIEGTIKLFDADNEVLYASEALKLIKTLSLPVRGDFDRNLFKVAVYQGDTRISNFAMVHLVALLNRTNPDNKLARFNELLNLENFSDLDLNELLEYAQFKVYSPPTSKQQYSNRDVIPDENSGDQNPDPVTAEEFNLSANLTDADETSRRKQLAMLEDFLNSLSFHLLDKPEDVSDSPEDAAVAAGDGGDKNESIVVGRHVFELSYYQGQLLQNRLANTLERINKSILSYFGSSVKQKLGKRDIEVRASMDHIKSVLIGCHLILTKRYSTFSEQRSLLKVKFKNKKEHEVLVNTFNLVRASDQTGNGMDQVTYSADENLVEKLKIFINKSSGLRLTYIDGTPSLKIDHFYFKRTVWSVNMNYGSAEKFICSGISTFLLMMIQGSDSLDGKDCQLWEVYKERLFFRILLMIHTYKWELKTIGFKELLLLNTFHTLLPKAISVESLVENLKNYLVKLQMEDKVPIGNFEAMVFLLNDYLSWKEKYDNNKGLLKKQLDNKKLGRIIFHKHFGFARIEHYYKSNMVNLETPLGYAYHDRQLTGFKEVFIGLNPVFL